ncbi:histidine phosphatase family protein [Streptococcus sp. H49]|uniref:histidine phosphatase family protein n=1 Tax=Streptococcus huangxiaojuni TaxID=3237239 RepID=UPI0034A1ED96
MRHGETFFNTQGRVQGACDSPLTDAGLAQAQLAKSYFDKNNIRFDAIYSSTQERASDTARLISGQEPIQLKGLKEMNFGEFEAQPENLLPKFRPGSRSFEDLLVPFGGEDIYDVGKRVRKSIDEHLQGSDAGSVLMVSHGAAMWGLCLELALHFPEGVGFSNCAICEFHYNAGSYAIQKLVLPTKNFQTIEFRETNHD